MKRKSQEPLTSQGRLGGSCAGIHLEPMGTENKEDHSACKWDFCSRWMTGCIRTAPRRGEVDGSHEFRAGEVKQF